MSKRTYIDSCVLIAAFKGEGELGWRAMLVLDDPGRSLVVSEAVRLEVFPKARYEKQQDEVAFYETVFSKAEIVPWNDRALHQAQIIAESYGIAAMDALHVAHAIAAGVDEFISAEKPTKPMFRVQSIPMRSIREA
jgi:hypothetical protein